MENTLLLKLDTCGDYETTCDFVEVYDNGGETYDRYSIYLEWNSENDMWTELISSSINPYHPLGFWTVAESLQFDYDVDTENEHLGSKIDFGELPLDVQNCVVNYIESVEKEINK